MSYWKTPKRWQQDEQDDYSSSKQRSSRWSAEEDEQLREAVQKEGYLCWKKIALHFQNRTSKQVRERWLNHLSPQIEKSPLTQSEIALLAELHAKYNNQWSLIAPFLPGRTPNQLKNYYNNAQRKKKREENKTSRLAAKRNAAISTSDDEDDSELYSSPKRRKLSPSHQEDQDAPTFNDDESFSASATSTPLYTPDEEEVSDANSRKRKRASLENSPSSSTTASPFIPSKASGVTNSAFQALSAACSIVPTMPVIKMEPIVSPGPQLTLPNGAKPILPIVVLPRPTLSASLPVPPVVAYQPAQALLAAQCAFDPAFFRMQWPLLQYASYPTPLFAQLPLQRPMTLPQATGLVNSSN